MPTLNFIKVHWDAEFPAEPGEHSEFCQHFAAHLQKHMGAPAFAVNVLLSLKPNKFNYRWVLLTPKLTEVIGFMRESNGEFVSYATFIRDYRFSRGLRA